MNISQLGYLGIKVSNIHAWEEFTTSVLGLEVSGRGANGTLYFRMDSYHHRLALYPGGDDDIAYIGWEVPDRKSMDGLTARLDEAGVLITRPHAHDVEERGVSDLIRFEDPNEVTLEAFYGPLLSDMPFRSPRAISGFRTGHLGLGHVVLATRDLERTVAFYRDTLGFRVTDVTQLNRPGTENATLVFFRCNPRHHSVAFSTTRSPKKMSHFLLDLNSLDDVRSAFSLCQEKGVRIVRDLIERGHSLDDTKSFYMESPSGFDVEYGWGERVVNDS